MYTAKLYFRALLYLLLAALVVVPIRAQEEIIGDLHTFNAAGQQHVIAWSLRNANPANRLAIQEAITRTFEVYNGLFGAVVRRVIPMRVYVYLQDNVKPDDSSALAAAGRRNGRIPTSPLEFGPVQDFCYVSVYNKPELTNQDVLKFTIAHEMSHCYQAFYLRAANPSLPEYREAEFWIEGGAEWLATQVFPAPDAGGMNGYRASFVNNNGKDLISGDINYDGVFYWGHLATAHSPAYVVGRLVELPQNKEELPAYFNSPTALEGEFARWGRALALGRVPYQPSASELLSRQLDAANPPARIAPVIIEPRTFRIIGIQNLERLSHELGLEVTLRGNFKANGVHVATLHQEFAPVEGRNELQIMFCTRGAGQFLAIGRDSVGTGDTTIDISVAQKSCDIDIISRYEVPAELTNASDTCYQGTWILTHWPIPQSVVLVTDYGNSYFEVDASGRFKLSLDGIEIRVDRDIYSRLYGLKFEGTLSTGHEPGSATFDVELSSASLTGTPRVTMQVGRSPEQTVSSDAFTNAFQQLEEGREKADLTLICREENTLEYRITVPGTTVSYFFTRMRLE